MISKLLIDFITFLNIGKTMGEAQIVETVKLIIEDYSALKPDDFVLFFSKAKRGYYGKIYDRMDGQIIFEWLEQFMYERDTEIERLRRNEQIKREKELASVTESVPMPEYFKPLMEKKVMPDKPLKREPTKQELQVKQFIADFDKEAVLVGSQKFVTRYGKKFNISEFLNYRIQGVS